MSKNDCSNLKKLVREAKSRMTNNGYEARKSDVAASVACAVYVDAEDERVYRLICDMQADGYDGYNPIGKLIDSKRFSAMNEHERERYVLELSERYKKLLERYRKEVGAFC